MSTVSFYEQKLTRWYLIRFDWHRTPNEFEVETKIEFSIFSAMFKIDDAEHALTSPARMMHRLILVDETKMFIE